MASTRLLVCTRTAHNPAAAGSLVQIQPPQPISLAEWRQLIAFTFFKIRKGVTLASPRTLLSGFNNIIPG